VNVHRVLARFVQEEVQVERLVVRVYVCDVAPLAGLTQVHEFVVALNHQFTQFVVVLDQHENQVLVREGLGRGRLNLQHFFTKF